MLPMRIIIGVIPGASRLARLQLELSKKPGKDLNGWITTLMVIMLASPAAILASAQAVKAAYLFSGAS